jgi:hypothetical protein
VCVCERERVVFWGLESVASPSLLSHGETRLDPFHGHAGALVGPREPRVHDGGRAHDLPHARGPRVPRSGGGIRGVLCGILRAGIRCAVTLIPPLIVATQQPGATQSDPLGDLAHHVLRDSV